MRKERLQQTQGTARVNKVNNKINYENESDISSVQNFKKRFQESQDKDDFALKSNENSV